MDEKKPRRAPRKTAATPGKSPAAPKTSSTKVAATSAAKAAVAKSASTRTAGVAAARRPAPAVTASASQPPRLDPELRARMIETAAYYRAERRGFAPGYEVSDWLAAEAEIEALIGGGTQAGRRR